MKRIIIVLFLLLNSCNQVLTNQNTNIQNTKIQESNKNSQVLKTNESVQNKDKIIKEDIKPNNTIDSSKLAKITETSEIEVPFIYLKNPTKEPITGTIDTKSPVNLFYLTFYHKYKIKFNVDTQLFYSIDESIDLTKLNNVIKYYKKHTKINIYPSNLDISEKEIDKSIEELKKAIPNYKAIYLYDTYHISIDSNILELFYDLNQLEFIESMQLNDAIGVTS